MSYGNNDNYNTTTGSAGLGNSNQYGQSQGFDEQNIGSQPYGQSNIGGNQGTTRSSGVTDSNQFGSGGREQLGSGTVRDNIASTGSDRYGSGTGMGGTGSGIGSTGDSYGSDPRNQGIGYGSDQSSGMGQQGVGQQGIGQQGMGHQGIGQQGQQGVKPSMGDKMRGGVEKGIGKMTGQPDLIEKGQERAVRIFKILDIYSSAHYNFIIDRSI
ncbi:hypothetical protein C0992_004119 [Termitomyces sp. T32_za158]|nr:hypothetical protein C0992_004119 [Termitomyces sp. T32_za158]